jgi:hypothetical protein
MHEDKRHAINGSECWCATAEANAAVESKAAAEAKAAAETKAAAEAKADPALPRFHDSTSSGVPSVSLSDINSNLPMQPSLAILFSGAINKNSPLDAHSDLYLLQVVCFLTFLFSLARLPPNASHPSSLFHLI